MLASLLILAALITSSLSALWLRNIRAQSQKARLTISNDQQYLINLQTKIGKSAKAKRLALIGKSGGACQ